DFQYRSPDRDSDPVSSRSRGTCGSGALPAAGRHTDRDALAPESARSRRRRTPRTAPRRVPRLCGLLRVDARTLRSGL
ncbi:MAG: hypothetical protein AVDCRST_MAG59-4235, partial [uncultured Thermomicrobiales bacterium]